VIGGGLDINEVLEEEVAARADRATGKGAFNHGSRRRISRREARRHEGIAPGRDGVPDILNRRIVVDVDSVENVEVSKLDRVGVPNVRFVEKDMLAGLGRGALHEGAAAKLEATTERRQLRKSRMAGSAGLTGLARKARKRFDLLVQRTNPQALAALDGACWRRESGYCAQQFIVL
jgi:hypothetical protein